MNDIITIEEQWFKRKGNDGQEFTVRRTRIQGQTHWYEVIVPERLSPCIVVALADTFTLDKK
jgi:hypothetical protein